MAAVCPACAINPSLSPRIELPPILHATLPPPIPLSPVPSRARLPRRALLRYLNSRSSSYTLFRIRMTERQRELISSFRRLVRIRLISSFSPSLFSFFDFFLFFPFFSPPSLLYFVGWWRIKGSNWMTYDFSGIGRNNKSDIVSFFSFRHWGLFTGITRNPEVLFHAIVRIPLGRAANSRFSTSRMKKKGREKKRERERERRTFTFETTWSSRSPF